LAVGISLATMISKYTAKMTAHIAKWRINR
jgi:hypothetical protein